MLNSLNFHCTVATCRQFLRRFAKAAMADHTTHEMSHYLSELSLLDDKARPLLPSLVCPLLPEILSSLPGPLLPRSPIIYRACLQRVGRSHRWV